MEWKLISEIPGYEDYTNYELNIAGDLRNRKTGRLRKWTIGNHGYFYANLCHNCIPLVILKHIAICRLFKPNPENKPIVDHFNKKKLDNSIKNLRWVTQAENMQNQSIRSDNTSGEQNITKKFVNKNPIWLIRLVSYRELYTKTFPRDPNSDVIPWEVIQWRDWMKLYYHSSATI